MGTASPFASARPRRAAGLLLVGGLLLAPACGLFTRPEPPPPAALRGWSQEGIASWYGEPFHGRQTASGETYDMEALTAAHRTLALGTVVRVQNLANGRTVTVRINDRGPYVGDRIIDLSRRAARELGMLGEGLARVRITVLETPDG